jgi:hypothetical protein
VSKTKQILGLLAQSATWTGYKKRFMGLARVDNRVAVDAIPNQTTTGRGGSTTILTLPTHVNKNKIGGEAKTKFTAPKGKLLVYFDFESQELQLLATFADSYVKHTGSTGLSQLSLAGDLHTTVQRRGVTRLCAKGLNYGTMYGCGVRKAANTITMHHPEFGKAKAKKFSKDHAALLKGTKDYDTGYYSGGLGSKAFNKQLDLLKTWDGTIANPVSGYVMPPAQTPLGCGDIGSPAQRNWFIQSTGKHMLDCVIVSNWFWYNKLGLDAYFSASCHDELVSTVAEQDVDQACKINSLSHLHSWVLVNYKLGIKDFPLARAFTPIGVDTVWRKSPDADTATVSSPQSAPPGYEFTMT